jgi:hypothetical protein
MYTINRFGAITLPAYMTDYNLSPLPAQLAFVQTTTGVFDNDGDKRSRQTFPLSVSYKALVAEDVYATNRTVLDALRAAVGTRAILYRTADNDATVHNCTARLASMNQQRPYSMRQNLFEFELNFQQLSPWRGLIHGAGWVFDSGVLLDNSRVLDEAPPTIINPNPTTIVCSNGGNIPVDDIQFTIIAGSAPITAIQIDGPAFSLGWVGSLLTGQSVFIDTGAAMVLKAGNNDYNAFALLPFHHLDRWASLSSGTNTLSVLLTGGGTNSTISIIYNDRWA